MFGINAFDLEKRSEVMKDNVIQEHVCEEEVPLNNNLGKLSGYLIEMPSEAVEQWIDDHVHDEIDGVKGEQVPNHAAKKGNLEFLVRKEVPNHGGDELKTRIKNYKRWHLFDSELENAKYKAHLYEMHLLLNPSQKEELENKVRRQEELAVLQVEFADMEGQMQQLMEELKKSQKNAFFWKSTMIVFVVVTYVFMNSLVGFYFVAVVMLT
ncbi:hypothetical protein Tco_0432089 [Tanacetum coccineum]